MNRLGQIRRGLADLVGGAILMVPGRVGSSLRVVYYRARGARLGQGVRIDSGVLIDHPERVSIGAESWVDRHAIVIAGDPRPGRETRLVGAGAIDPGTVRVGQRCHIGAFTVISGMGGLELGDDVTISAGSKLYSLSHHFRSWANPSDETYLFGSQAPDDKQAMLQGPISIGTNVGVGADCLVLPGTRIGPRSFVRPKAVVQGDWPANVILAGAPAVQEGPRFPDRA